VLNCSHGYCDETFGVATSRTDYRASDALIAFVRHDGVVTSRNSAGQYMCCLALRTRLRLIIGKKRLMASGNTDDSVSTDEQHDAKCARVVAASSRRGGLTLLFNQRPLTSTNDYSLTAA
jgi:hypothetical protein